MTSQKMNGKDIGANNLIRFNAWIEERKNAGDWKDYVRQGKLNRSEIASECNFALSALRQNPAVKAALEALEASLRDQGVIGATGGQANAVDDPTGLAVARRVLVAKGRADERAKVLEEQNAVLRAEVRDLREQLKRYKHLDDHLCRTGRMLHS